MSIRFSSFQMAATALLSGHPHVIVSGLTARLAPTLGLSKGFRAAAEADRSYLGLLNRDGWSSGEEFARVAAEELLREISPSKIEPVARYLTRLFEALRECFCYHYEDVRIHSINPNVEGLQDPDEIVTANVFHTDRSIPRSDGEESFMLLHTLDGGSHDLGTEVADLDEKLYEHLLSKDNEMRSYRERWGTRDEPEGIEEILRGLRDEIDGGVPEDAIIPTRTYDSMVLRLTKRPTFHRAPLSSAPRLLLIIDKVVPLG